MQAALRELAATLRRPVEQLPGGMQHVGATVIARVGVVDDFVFQREGAETMELIAADVDLGSPRSAKVEPGTGSALFVREHGEVEVEVASGGRDPREAPSHPAPVGLQVLDRGARDGDEGHVPRREMDDGAVEAVRGVRTAEQPASGQPSTVGRT